MNELREAYARGFMAKCAELGVDPEQLVKQAGIADMAAKGLAKGKDLAAKGVAKGKGITKGKELAKSRPAQVAAGVTGGAAVGIAAQTAMDSKKKASVQKQAFNPAALLAKGVTGLRQGAQVAGQHGRQLGQVAGQQGRHLANAFTGKSVNKLTGILDGLKAKGQLASEAGASLKPGLPGRIQNMERMLADAKTNRNLVRGGAATGVAGVGYNMLTDHD
jgi:hypothetical protein